MRSQVIFEDEPGINVEIYLRFIMARISKCPKWM